MTREKDLMDTLVALDAKRAGVLLDATNAIGTDDRLYRNLVADQNAIDRSILRVALQLAEARRGRQ